MYKIIINNSSNYPVYSIVNIESGKLIKECYSKAEADACLASCEWSSV